MNIIDLIFPKLCVGCREEGQYICRHCQVMLIKPDPICPMCCKASVDGWVHARCKTAYSIDRLLVGLPYRGLVQDCLKKVKYKSSWDVINFLFSLCDFGDIGDDFFVTAVPMFAQKERERGFNQAGIIAQLLAKYYKVRSFVMLDRVRETRPMFGLSKSERHNNIQGAFSTCRGVNLRGIEQRRIILVDDVWTTGSTMRECAKVLKQAGIKEVWGVTLAR